MVPGKPVLVERLTNGHRGNFILKITGRQEVPCPQRNSKEDPVRPFVSGDRGAIGLGLMVPSPHSVPRQKSSMAGCRKQAAQSDCLISTAATNAVGVAFAPRAGCWVRPLKPKSLQLHVPRIDAIFFEAIAATTCAGLRHTGRDTLAI